MVFFLRESRDGDRPNHACAFYNNREAAAMRGELAFRDAIGLFDGFAFVFKQLPHVERAVTESIHQSYLALDPLVVVRSGAGHAVMEELLLSTGDVDGDGEIFAHGSFHHLSSDLPGGRLIKAGELKFLFFLQ